MATSAVYTLQRMAERDEPLTGDEEPSEGAFETGGRVSWDFTLRLLRVESGATVEVVVESSPNEGDDEDWTEVVSFGSQTDTSNSPVKKAGQTVTRGERFVRSRATTLSGGKVTYEVEASSPFFQLSGDQGLLSQALRDVNTDDQTRIVELAEQMVLDDAIGRDELGRLEADLNEVGALEKIKRAVGRQADHLHQRDKLTTSREPESLQALGRWAELAPEVHDIVGPILPNDGARVVRSLR